MMVGEVADAGAYAHVSACISEEFGEEGNALGFRLVLVWDDSKFHSGL